MTPLDDLLKYRNTLLHHRRHLAQLAADDDGLNHADSPRAQGRRIAAPVIGLVSVTFSSAWMRHSPSRRVTIARISVST